MFFFYRWLQLMFSISLISNRNLLQTRAMAIRNNLNWHFIPDQFCQREKEREDILKLLIVTQTNDAQFKRFKFLSDRNWHQILPLYINSCQLQKAPGTQWPAISSFCWMIWLQVRRGGRQTPPSTVGNVGSNQCAFLSAYAEREGPTREACVKLRCQGAGWWDSSPSCPINMQNLLDELMVMSRNVWNL